MFRSKFENLNVKIECFVRSLRNMMSKFIRHQAPDMHVLAYTEIPDNKQITIEATVGGEFVKS